MSRLLEKSTHFDPIFVFLFLLYFVGALAIEDCVPSSSVESQSVRLAKIKRTGTVLNTTSGVVVDEKKLADPVVGDGSKKCCMLSSFKKICSSSESDDSIVVDSGSFEVEAGAAFVDGHRHTLSRKHVTPRIGDNGGGTNLYPFKATLTNDNPYQSIVNTDGPYNYDVKLKLTRHTVEAVDHSIVHMSAVVYTFPQRCEVSQVITYFGNGIDFIDCKKAPNQPPKFGTLGDWEYCIVHGSGNPAKFWFAVKIGDRFFDIGFIEPSESNTHNFNIALIAFCDIVNPQNKRRFSGGDVKIIANPSKSTWDAVVTTTECVGLGVCAKSYFPLGSYPAYVYR